VLASPVRAALQRCAGAASCDAFYGCALRLRLVHLRGHPWKRQVIRARRLLRELAAQPAAGAPAVPGVDARGAAPETRPEARGEEARGEEARGEEARGEEARGEETRTEKGTRGVQAAARWARCVALSPLRRRLGALKQRAARRALQRLNARCRQVLSAVLAAVAETLDSAEASLELTPAERACAWLGRPGQPVPGAGAAAAALTARRSALRSRCQALVTFRGVSTAVQDAERDAAEVRRLLKSGKLPSSAYHKCAHKADTLRVLGQSAHRRARKAAAALRRICFERFPRAWLRRQQRRAAGEPLPGGCYRLRRVLGLLTGHGQATVRNDSRKLIRWAKRRCPPGG